MLTRNNQGSSDEKGKCIEIRCDGQRWSRARFLDGKYAASDDGHGKIRRWRVEDGKQVGMAGSTVWGLAVSPNGRWVVTECSGHKYAVYSVDVSPDVTKIASGPSRDKTVRTWMRSTARRLLGPREHDNIAGAVKFSPNGQILAIAICQPITAIGESVCLYDRQNGCRLFSIISTEEADWSGYNQSLAWMIGSSKQLLVLSLDRNILQLCLDTPTISPLEKWHVRGSRYPECITLTNSDAFIAASNNSVVSLCGARTHGKRIITRILHDIILSSCYRMFIATLTGIPPLDITNTVSEQVRANKLIMDWLAEFTNWCITMLKVNGDEVSNAGKYVNALAAYMTALALDPPTRNLLTKWSRIVLISDSVNEALAAAFKSKLSRFLVYKAICNILDGNDNVAKGIECFRLMYSKLGGETGTHAKQVAREDDFRSHCVRRLEKLGDIAMDAGDHDTAIRHYSDALSFGSTDPDIFVKRSKAKALIGAWEDALIDADKAIKLDPSSYKGYERKYTALRGMNHHAEAFEAFEAMISKIEQSPDLAIRKLRDRYVNATSTIRQVVQETICDMPRVLIHITTGRLCHKAQQAAAFEELPIFDELRSSMTAQLDRERIREEVKKFYRYVMLSHRWDYGEPLFQQVLNISIYDLESSHANTKLQMLCRIADSFGFHWVWSDTCCIDKKDTVVLQESLVAMFTWYHGSSLTVVYLRGVWSRSHGPGDLWRSTWNTRAWTYQEYVAAETVQFYTEDWKPYLRLSMFNHKVSYAIISEMQQADRFPTRELDVHRPGLDRVREKLFVASERQATLVEDIAYSLLGIFNASISVIYGEGNRAIGRLLEYLVNGSSDITILAWTGKAGKYNSCLPVDLIVYNELVPPHVPQRILMDKMGGLVAALRSSLPDLSLALVLYDRLHKLPLVSCNSSRMSISGIVFSITQVDDTSESDGTDQCVYRATSSALGEVLIKTADHLSGKEDLVLVHPWISPLLDQERSYSVSRLDRTTRALRLVVRLRQPFGALLLEPLSRTVYRRVASDCLIMVQIREEVLLDELIGSIRTVEIQ